MHKKVTQPCFSKCSDRVRSTSSTERVPACSRQVARGLRFVFSRQSRCCAVLLLSALTLAITAAADGQRVGVMSQTVEGSAGQQVVVKDLGPFLEGAIAGDDDRGPFVALADDLVQVLGRLGRQRIEAKIVENEQVGLENFAPQSGVTTAGLGGAQVPQQVMHGIGQDAKLAFQGFDAQAIRQVAFSDAAGAAQQDVLAAGDEGAGGQVLDQGTIDARRRRKVEVRQRLLAVTAGLSQMTHQPTMVAPFQLIVEQQGQEFDRRELPFDGLRGPEVERFHHSREAELAQFG